jgi:hypothetical protein
MPGDVAGGVQLGGREQAAVLGAQRRGHAHEAQQPGAVEAGGGKGRHALRAGRGDRVRLPVRKSGALDAVLPEQALPRPAGRPAAADSAGRPAPPPPRTCATMLSSSSERARTSARSASPPLASVSTSSSGRAPSAAGLLTPKPGRRPAARLPGRPASQRAAKRSALPVMRVASSLARPAAARGAQGAASGRRAVAPQRQLRARARAAAQRMHGPEYHEQHSAAQRAAHPARR